MIAKHCPLTPVFRNEKAWESTQTATVSHILQQIIHFLTGKASMEWLFTLKCLSRNLVTSSSCNPVLLSHLSLIATKQQQDDVAAPINVVGENLGSKGTINWFFHFVPIYVNGGPIPINAVRAAPAKGLPGNDVHKCALKHRPPNCAGVGQRGEGCHARMGLARSVQRKACSMQRISKLGGDERWWR